MNPDAEIYKNSNELKTNEPITYSDLKTTNNVTNSWNMCNCSSGCCCPSYFSK